MLLTQFPALTLLAQDCLYRSESDVCGHQILTYKDCPYAIMTHNIRIQMKQKDRTKTFMMIVN